MSKQHTISYTPLFNGTRSNPSLSAIGDELYVIFNSGKPRSGWFLGFDFYQICLSEADENMVAIDIKKIKTIRWKDEMMTK